MHGYFMESLMDFSAAIKLELDKQRELQRESEKNTTNQLTQQAQRKFQLDEYYRNAG